MKVLGYARVSTEEQATHGVSLTVQRQKMQQYAELYDLELIDVFEDAGFSARTTERPALKQALAALESGQAEGLVVARLDRLTRSVADMASLIQRYFGERFSLFSVSDQVDTRTASGRLVLHILVSVSQWEREAIGERTRAALAHKKAQGVRLGSPPLGDAPAEAETVARMKELRGRFMTLREIATQLEAEGRRTKRGGQAETVRKGLAREGVQ